MSYATIEAMASGLPVVAFDVGGMRQALGAGDHLLAPTDYDELLEQVVDLFSDRERRRELGHRNRARAVALFDEKPLLEEIDRAVRSLV
jgi:glycosyltransferase involved in cell wall biosynthesis